MYDLTIVIAAAAAALVVGLLLGLMFGRRSSPAGQKHREVERKLDQVLQDKKVYEDEVVEHFSETAQLLNDLTKSYRNVHNHLAKGAGELCQGKGPVALVNSARDPAEIPQNLTDVQQPLDYAPKTSPDEKGMLNEEFGLDRSKTAENADEVEAPPRV
ncbi:DUF1043 family protein [Halioglobus maricola]|uniref:Z-ring associated protein G n=1 Tax=Halioglobus maricola TaxID=2601894 RepID=A0A5P9NGR0_9GAMM|nr:DUF1043 family protein [Halioglobus maricola]QFU74962.1 DUF1043 family protein [Halioglobus maricola]